MKQKKLFKKIFLTLLSLPLFFCLIVNKNVLAQSAFPPAGSSFDTATEIKPGEYSGAKLNWNEEEGITKLYYYINNIKSGQAIEAATGFFGDTLLNVRLYDSNKRQLIYVFGGNDIEPLVWMIGSSIKTDKYYLVIENDAINQATDISLNLKVSDKYDANSSVDAGDILTESLLISSGNFSGYFSGEQGNDNTDFYNLKLKKGEKISVKIIPPSKDSIDLEVYDTNRANLDQNTSSGSGQINTLSFTPANDGDYYLKLTCNYGCEKVVAYQMEISGDVLPTGGGLITTPGDNNPKDKFVQDVSLNNQNNKFMLIIGLTVVAIIIIVFLIIKKKPIEKEELQMNSGNPDADKSTVGYKHPCKYCSKLIPANSKTCPFCGKNNPQGPIRCPKCSSPIEKDWKICNNCDLPLSIKCPKCQKTTFFGDYCEHCDGRLTVVCSNCGSEQPPIDKLCKKCKKPLKVENKK
jgi:hypothetical protein